MSERERCLPQNHGAMPVMRAAASNRAFCVLSAAPHGSELDYFAAMGLPRKLLIDPVCLEETYHDLGRRIHPDRFASSPVKLRDASLRATALLTRSYRTLRDPISRGLYWLELAGVNWPIITTMSRRNSPNWFSTSRTNSLASKRRALAVARRPAI